MGRMRRRGTLQMRRKGRLPTVVSGARIVLPLRSNRRLSRTVIRDKAFDEKEAEESSTCIASLGPIRDPPSICT